MNLTRIAQQASDLPWFDLHGLHAKHATPETWTPKGWRTLAFPKADGELHLFQTDDTAPSSYVLLSSQLARVLGMTHPNLLRTLRRFERTGMREAPTEDDSLLTGFRVVGLKALTHKQRIHKAVLWLPTFHRFLSWWLAQLQGKDARQTKIDLLHSSMGWLSGLTPPSSSDCFLHEELSAIWPAEVQSGDLISNDKPASAPVLWTTSPSFADERISLVQVADVTGYTVKHLLKTMKQHRLIGSIQGEFLRADNTGKVSGRTVMYLLMVLPRAFTQRMAVFERLFAQVTPAVPTLQRVSPTLRGVDTSNPQALVDAFNVLEHQLEQDRENTASKLRELSGMVDENTTALRSERARTQGMTAELESLRISLAAAASHGQDVKHPQVAEGVYHARKLREQGLVTIDDVITELTKRLGADVVKQLAFESGLLNRADNFLSINTLRAVIRFVVAERFLRADEQPVMRVSTVNNDYARVYKVFVGSNSSAGNRFEHGTERNWRWSVFYTAAGQALFYNPTGLKDFMLAFAQAGKPAHMVRRDNTRPEDPASLGLTATAGATAISGTMTAA